MPRDEVAGRLNSEKARKNVLTAERDRLTKMLHAAEIDAPKIKAELLAKVSDVKALLGQQIPRRGRCSGSFWPTRSSSSPWVRAEGAAISSVER